MIRLYVKGSKALKAISEFVEEAYLVQWGACLIVSRRLDSPLVLCYGLHGVRSLGLASLSSLEVSKLQLHFTSSSSSQILKPGIVGPGTSVTLKIITLILSF